jgi:hypothetical protein
MKTRTKAALFLLFFAPINAELLSASSPPIEFFFPTTFILLTLFYGTGVLLVHELAIRWGKGWPTIMLLGLAYGVIEEGLVTMSFFNSHWMDIGFLGTYGNFLDINWNWCVNLSIFHGVWSISVPILVMRLIFPSVDGQAVLGRRALVAAVVTFPAVSFLLTVSTVVVTGYLAPPLQYLGAVTVVALLILMARRAPHRLLAVPGERPSRSVSRFGVVGLCFSAGFFLIMYLVPFLQPSPFIAIALMICLTAAAARYFERNLGISRNDRQKWSMFVGLETVFVGWTFLHELTPSTNTRGMALVGIAYLIFFIWLRMRIDRRTEIVQIPPSQPAPPS